jgi:hypothetical protein
MTIVQSFGVMLDPFTVAKWLLCDKGRRPWS